MLLKLEVYYKNLTCFDSESLNFLNLESLLILQIHFTNSDNNRKKYNNV